MPERKGAHRFVCRSDADLEFASSLWRMGGCDAASVSVLARQVAANLQFIKRLRPGFLPSPPEFTQTPYAMDHWAVPAKSQ